MSARSLLLIVVISLLAPCACYAAQCPADPYKASQTIWPLGVLTKGQEKTAVHPCGRKITCIGGRFDPDVKRSCHWG